MNGIEKAKENIKGSEEIREMKPKGENQPSILPKEKKSHNCFPLNLPLSRQLLSNVSLNSHLFYEFQGALFLSIGNIILLQSKIVPWCWQSLKLLKNVYHSPHEILQILHAFLYFVFLDFFQFKKILGKMVLESSCNCHWSLCKIRNIF